MLRDLDSEKYVSKLNVTKDKAYLPGEEQLMTEADRALFEQNKLLPGEAINYTPRTLSKTDRDALSPDLREIYDARVEQAGKWDQYLGPENADVIDMTKQSNIDKYGPYIPKGDPTDAVTDHQALEGPQRRPAPGPVPDRGWRVVPAEVPGEGRGHGRHRWRPGPHTRRWHRAPVHAVEGAAGGGQYAGVGGRSLIEAQPGGGRLAAA